MSGRSDKKANNTANDKKANNTANDKKANNTASDKAGKQSGGDASPFPVGLGELFRRAFSGYFKSVVPVSAAGLVTLVSFYLLVALPAQAIDSQASLVDLVVESIVLVVGLAAVGTVAYPWYSYALDAAAGDGIRLGRPFEKLDLFMAQAVASFWFWAGVGLGFRYLAGIPAIIAVLLYAFHGYFIADRRTDSGLKALGLSVRLTQGRRIGLFGIGALLLLFTMIGGLPLGTPDANGDPIVNPFTIAAAVVGLTVTTSITLVAGAVLYLELQAQDDVSVLASSRPRGRSSGKSSGKSR